MKRKAVPKTHRAGRRNGRRKDGDAIWIVVIFVCLALISGAVGFAITQMSGRSYDETTLCRGEGADHVTVVLLDLTDPLNTTQAQRLRTMLDREIAGSPPDTMISFGIVSDDETEWGSRFAKCKPPTGDAANALYENPRLIAERYDEEFRTPLETTLASMIRVGESDRSPIMEALQALIAQTPDFASTPGDRKIVIVSDMLQHSETLSAYRGEGWEHFETTGGKRRLAGNLDGVYVEIIRIPRRTRVDVDLSEDFWVRYFDHQGSRLPAVRALGDL